MAAAAAAGGNSAPERRRARDPGASASLASPSAARQAAARDGLDDRRGDVRAGVVVRVPELRQRRGVERRARGRPRSPRPLGHAAAAREAVRQMRDRRRRVRVDGRGQRPGQGRRAHYTEPLPRGPLVRAAKAASAPRMRRAPPRSRRSAGRAAFASPPAPPVPHRFRRRRRQLRLAFPTPNRGRRRS